MFKIEPTKKEIEYLKARDQYVICIDYFDQQPVFATFIDATRRATTIITLEKYIDLMMNEINNSNGTENKENITWVTDKVHEDVVTTTKSKPKS